MPESTRELKDNLKQLVSSAKKVAGEIGDEIARTTDRLVEEARSLKRQTVISVRLDDETVRRLQQLIDAGVCKTRSEAVAFLTRAGMRSREELFRKIEERVAEIQRIREELRREARQQAEWPGESPSPEPEEEKKEDV